MTLRGSTTPRLWTKPLAQGPPGPCGCGCPLTAETSEGFAVAEFADLAGLPLLPWQRWLVIHGMERRPDGLPRFRTLLILVARQQGKTTLLKVLALYWLLVQQVPLVLGTSTKLDYARESWEGARQIAEDSPDLRVEFPLTKAGGIDARRANGEQTLTTLGGCRYKIAAANTDAGRSLTVHRLILDELRQHKSWAAWSAATKAGNAVPDFQGWAITNAGEDTSVVLNSLRERALKQMAGDQSGRLIGRFEWSAPADAGIHDRQAWAQANPALGYGLVTEDALAEAAETDPETVFKTEVLCQHVPALTPPPITLADWTSCHTPTPIRGTDVVFALDLAWNRSGGSIAAATRGAHGVPLVELVRYANGPTALVDEAAELARRYPNARWVGCGAVESIRSDLRKAGVSPKMLKPAEVESAHGQLQDAVRARAMVHNSAELDAVVTQALEGAVRKDTETGWVWTRRKSGQDGVDISPLYAVTLAFYVLSSGHSTEVY